MGGGVRGGGGIKEWKPSYKEVRHAEMGDSNTLGVVHVAGSGRG